MNFEKIELDKKEALLRQIGKMYRASEMELDIHYNFQVNEKQTTMFKHIEIKNRVDLALKRLCDYQMVIIRKEYLEHNRKNWYLGIFREDDYKECKERSINAFLHMLYG